MECDFGISCEVTDRITGMITHWITLGVSVHVAALFLRLALFASRFDRLDTVVEII